MQSYKKSLQDLIASSTDILEDNLRRQDELTERIQELEADGQTSSSSRRPPHNAQAAKSLAVFSHPYFKDSRGFSHPPNKDTVKKRRAAKTMPLLIYY